MKNNLERITKKEAEKLVKENKATFMSFGFDKKYILRKDNNYYRKNLSETHYIKLEVLK